MSLKFVNAAICYRQKKDNLDMTANYTTFRGDLESIHNAVHHFIGGTMLSASCTGFEPMFYMHHAYIDYVWEEYRQKQTPFKRENDFPKGGRYLKKLCTSSLSTITTKRFDGKNFTKV